MEATFNLLNLPDTPEMLKYGDIYVERETGYLKMMMKEMPPPEKEMPPP